MTDRMSEVVAPRRFSAMTLGAFASGSLLLAATGLMASVASGSPVVASKPRATT
jgi:hypothetical protein